jgi:hypothetical protein
MTTISNHASFNGQLGRYGLTVDDVQGKRLESKDGGPIVLDTSGGRSAAQPIILTTTDLDQMRSWLRPPDDRYAAMTKAITTSFPYAATKQADSHDEHDRLITAAYDYIFHGGGYSAAVAREPDIKSAIEDALGEMKLAVFAGVSIVVRPGQPLIVNGTVPVALNYAEMTIYKGGQVIIYPPGTMTIQTLKKVS